MARRNCSRRFFELLLSGLRRFHESGGSSREEEAAFWFKQGAGRAALVTEEPVQRVAGGAGTLLAGGGGGWQRVMDKSRVKMVVQHEDDAQMINWEWFSNRTCNVLKREGITKVLQLASYSEDDLLSLDNLGRKSLNEIKAVLGEQGLKLNNGPTGDRQANLRLQKEERYLEKLKFERSVYDKEIQRVNDVIARLRSGDLVPIPERSETSHVDPATYHFPGLTEKENIVVIARGAGRTLADIAGELEIVPSRIRQLEGAALRKLRHPRMLNLRPVIHQLGLCKKVYSCCTCDRTSPAQAAGF